MYEQYDRGDEEYTSTAPAGIIEDDMGDYQTRSRDFRSKNFADVDNLDKQESPLKKRLFGIAIVVGIVVSWIGSGEFANYSEQNMSFNNSFFLVYVLDLWNVFILPLFCLFTWLSVLIREGIGRGSRHCPNPYDVIISDMEKDRMSPKKLMKTALVSTFNQVVADYGYFRALSITSTSSGIVLFNLSSVFAYILSFFILKENLSLVKGGAVALAFGGAALITFSDQRGMHEIVNGADAWVGDVIMSAAALFWALYLVYYKRFVGDPSFGVINMQGTLVGIFDLFFLWPLLIILHVTKVEIFRIPTGETFNFVLITTGLAFINNYLFTFGTAVTSPVFVTIGGMLAIPGSVFVDWFFRGGTMSVFKIVGTCIMFVAFVLINQEDDLDYLLKSKLKQCLQYLKPIN